MTNGYGRKYDVVVYGATGFTGRLVAKYLDEHAADVRWAVAGRNRDKLAAIVAELRRPVDVLLADTTDPTSLSAMAAATQVVVSAVGPYAEHGMPLVDACVAARTDYVDMTGEPAFVHASIDRHHAAAVQAGVRIVHCCGIDSIPHDLGVYFALQKLGAADDITVAGYVRTGGTTLSGGTWHSALGAMADRAARAPLPLLPPGDRTLRTRMGGLHRPRIGGLAGWAVPLPTIDPQIILRSASGLVKYGKRFTYAHHLVVKHLATLVAGALVIGGIGVLAQFAPTRRWLAKQRPSGQGPSQAQLDNGWFDVTFVAKGDGRTVIARVACGEPYRETATMIGESALALVVDRARLPEIGRGGVLTPALAFGDVLIARLVKAGMSFATI